MYVYISIHIWNLYVEMCLPTVVRLWNVKKFRIGSVDPGGDVAGAI